MSERMNELLIKREFSIIYSECGDMRPFGGAMEKSEGRQRKEAKKKAIISWMEVASYEKREIACKNQAGAGTRIRKTCMMEVER